MTMRELALAALRHEETEQIPRNFMLTPLAAERLRLHYGVDDLPTHVGSCVYLFGCVDKPLYAAPEKYGLFITDQFGVVWATSPVDRGYPVSHPLRDPTLDGYEFPDPLEPRRWEAARATARRCPDALRLAVIGDLWERAHFMRGLNRLLLDLRLEPAFVHELLDRICEYDLATLEGMVSLAPDGIFISDDYGSQRGLMMSPEDWRAFVAPRLSRLISAAQRHGLVTMLHSCGNVSAIVPDFIRMGLSILHPMQPEAMDVFALKREYGRDITFCGGISTQTTLPFGTPGEVAEEVGLKADLLGAGGGYILEPGITIQADVPLPNLVALVETARDYRRTRTRPTEGGA